jgi:hypothetical protein
MAEEDRDSKEKYDPAKEERDYRRFVRSLDNGKAEKAYETLKINPKLVSYIRIIELHECYSELLRGAGEQQAIYFLARCIKEFNNTVERDIPLETNLLRAGENLRLEKLLGQMDEEHKKMLEDLE